MRLQWLNSILKDCWEKIVKDLREGHDCSCNLWYAVCSVEEILDGVHSGSKEANQQMELSRVEQERWMTWNQLSGDED